MSRRKENHQFRLEACTLSTMECTHRLSVLVSFALQMEDLREVEVKAKGGSSAWSAVSV
jgi:hypothetical protein